MNVRPGVIRADARELPLISGSVDLVVASPPFYGARDYTDGGRSLANQIGLEPTPWQYLGNLLTVTAELARVLRPTGSIFINVGDRYAERANAGPSNARAGGHSHALLLPPTRRTTGMAPVKSLLGLPWRYALACVDQLGLLLRQEIVWSKPNAMPESVTDRARRTHEHWFHFVKSPRYYASEDAIRQGATPGAATAGALPGSVWEIATRRLDLPGTLPPEAAKDPHFAAFPVDWPIRLIAGWSPLGWCTSCEGPRRPTAVTTGHGRTPGGGRTYVTMARQNGRNLNLARAAVAYRQITGLTCDCDTPTAPAVPAVVLDPFAGAGTTGLAARILGRNCVLADLSQGYCHLTRWRVNDRVELARAAETTRPDRVPDAQLDLLDGVC